MKEYKTFEDLVFKPHVNPFFEGLQAIIFFPNGYGASVVFGKNFYSNGVDTYEIACLKGNPETAYLVYPTGTSFEQDVRGYCDKDTITKLLKEIQDFRPEESV